MKESEYVDAGNIARVLTAREVLRNVVLHSGTEESMVCASVVQQLFELSGLLYEKLGDLDGDLDEPQGDRSGDAQGDLV